MVIVTRIRRNANISETKLYCKTQSQIRNQLPRLLMISQFLSRKVKGFFTSTKIYDLILTIYFKIQNKNPYALKRYYFENKFKKSENNL